MAGFSKDISTNVKIPAVEPLPQASGDDVSDALNIASFGLNLYNQFQQQEAQERLRQIENTISTSAASAMTEIQDRIAQKGQIDDYTLNRIASKYRPQGVGPTGLLQYNEIMAKQLTNPAITREVSQVEKTISSLRAIDKESKGLVSSVIATNPEFKGETLDTMSADKLGALEVAVNSFRFEQEKTKNDERTFLNRPSVQNYRQLADSYEKSGLETQINMSLDYFNRAKEEGTVLDLQTLQESKNILSQMTLQFKTDFNRLYEQATISSNMTPKELERLKEAHNARIKRLDANVAALDKMTDESFEKTARILSAQKAQGQADVYPLYAELLANVELMPTQVQGPVFDLLLASGTNKQLLTKRLQDAFQTGFYGSTEKGVDVNLAAFATTAQTRDLTALNQMLFGKSLESFDADEIDAKATEMYKWVSDIVNGENFASELGKAGVLDKVGLSLIGVLKRAEEVGDEQSKINAMQLLSKTGKIDTFMQELNKVSPNEAKIVARYVASFGATDAESFTKANKGVVFDAKKNEFVSRDTNRPTFRNISGDPRGSRVSMRQGQADEQRKNMLIKKNQAFKTTADLLRKYHPALSEGRDAEHYLLSFVDPSQINGTIKSFVGEEQEAIDQGVSLEELKERTKFSTQVSTQRENLQDVLEGTLQQDNPNAQPSLTPEQERQLEIIQELRTNRDPEVRLALLEELDKLDG